MQEQPQDFDQNYRFNIANEQAWKKYLKENGFVVIANWLNSQQCQDYVNKSWDMMQELSMGKLKRNDASTQILSNCYPVVLHGGMIQYVGHSQMQWDLRKKCKPIFQVLWKTNNLKTSFDGFCFMNGNRNYKPKPINSFLHCDQSPNKNYVWSYQGVQTLTDSGDNQGGFVVVPKSNNYHHKYFSKKKMLQQKTNWYLVPQQDKYLQPFCYCCKINTKAGDFILFDSRTFHCNTVPKQKSLRICTYICMIPANKVSQRTMQIRKKAYKDKRTSNHHPGDGFKLFPVLPRFAKERQEFLEIVQKVNVHVLDKDTQDLI